MGFQVAEAFTKLDGKTLLRGDALEGASVSGKISADGAFEGSIAAGYTVPMTGKFEGNTFAGSFVGPSCGPSRVSLERT